MLVFLGLHVGTTVIDTYTSISVDRGVHAVHVVVQDGLAEPGRGGLDMLVALVATSLLRARIGHRAWRRVHWLAYACWPVAVAHGLGIGTDRNATWVFDLTVACAAAVVARRRRLVGAARLEVQ